MRELSLARSPGVVTLSQFVCKPKILINNSECLGSGSISTRSGACPNGGSTHRITQFRNRTSHESRSYGRENHMLQCVSRMNVRSSVP